MKEIIAKVKILIRLYKEGSLGGERMPEDSRPEFKGDCKEKYLYLTLPMALNYQRNSYKLWESALQTWSDQQCEEVFNPFSVLKMSETELRDKLTKYKVALQPNKQPQIWKRLCQTLIDRFHGDVRVLFKKNNNDILKIKTFILQNKKEFPYLSGAKILNYWLYVMTQYTETKFVNVQEISVAPDTHVLQASVKLGVVAEEELKKNNIREIVSERWKEILNGTGIQPIDIHTPFWLWSRSGFKVEI
ncbi:MAG: hypothetical protein E7375_00410 [Clostridiales bacterium]|nr:hypothetical protein [Clostridiales bacterium]